MMFTKDQIKDLAEVDRMMDSGDMPFVWLDGERVACSRECMTELGMAPGQTISRLIFHEILKWNIADCEAGLVEQRLAATAAPGKE
jgi:hypothetical protein